MTSTGIGTGQVVTRVFVVIIIVICIVYLVFFRLNYAFSEEESLYDVLPKQVAVKNTPNVADEGYFLIANDEAYVSMLVNFTIPAIRSFDPDRPITVLSMVSSYVESLHVHNLHAIHYNPDDYIFYFPSIEGWRKGLASKVEVYGMIPKIVMMELTPYKYSMFLDTDVIPIQNINSFWNFSKSLDRDIVITGDIDEWNRAPRTWHWGDIDHVMTKTRLAIPQISSGVLFWKKKNDFVNTILPYYNHYQQFGILKRFRDSIPDEIIIAIYMGIHSIRPIPYHPYQLYTNEFSRDVNHIFVHITSKSPIVLTQYKELALEEAARSRERRGFRYLRS